MDGTIDLSTFLDDQPIGRAQFSALIMCSFALLLDGFDIYLVGSIAPAISAHFRVSAASLSLVFLLQQIGLAGGAFLISPLSDHIGRKPVLLTCTAAYGLLTLLVVWSRTLLDFAMLRCAAGVFLGGVVPNALALLVESTPRRRQGLFVSIAFTGYAAGAVGGAIIAALLIRPFGWAVGFLIGGSLPFAYVLLALAAVPESIQFLARRNPEDPAVQQLARRLRPSLGDSQVHVRATAKPIRAAGAQEIFAGGRGGPTLLIWGIFFLAIGTFGLILAWLPTLYHERAGISLEAYSKVAAVALGFSLIGTLTIGYVLDRFNPTRVILFVFLLVLACLQVLAHARFGTGLFVLSFSLLIFFQGCGQTGINAIIAQFYPAHIRSTGIGWAFGAGRVGGIVGPMAGGAMIAAQYSVTSFFLFLSLPVVVITGLLFRLEHDAKVVDGFAKSPEQRL